jgi:hypothetical protein
MPVKAVAPSAFEIEPERTGGTGKLAGLETGRSGASPQAVSLRRPARRPHPLLLQSWKSTSNTCSKAGRNEQVALTRSAGGSLRVEGVVIVRNEKKTNS